SSRAEENDDRSSKTLMGKVLKERKRRANSTSYIYEDDDSAGREAAGQKLVVNVPMIGTEDGLSPEETADDGDAGIQKRDRECDQGGGHAQDGGAFLAPANP